MIFQDLHTHTVYCDGRNTPEEMVEAAIAKGLSRIGFSGHSFTDFDTSYCMSAENTVKYLADITALKEKYRAKIEILCGVEQDIFSLFPTLGFDFVIGSVHYIKVGEEYIPVDESAAILNDAAARHFGGDIYALAECYFATVGEVLARTGADIIGHFDLISKFNEGGRLLDEAHPRYVQAYTAAIDRLLPFEKPFEINTGAIARGYRTHPYPSRAQIEYIAARGGSFILTGDTHAAENLCFEFEKWQDKYKEIGVL